MSRQILLAVDGGNSKTDVVLVGRDGSVLATVRGGGSSPHQLGLDGSMRVLDHLVADACSRAGIRRNGRPVAAVGAWFMAGADLPAEERALGRAVERLGWADHNHVANDTFAILRAGAEIGWGVAVVVGAGVNCVAISPTGRTARFPALGDITGDWGGGPDIGLAALGAAVRAEDGRGPSTQLKAAVTDYFRMRRATEVGIAIHQGRLARERLLELAPLVMIAATRGDQVANSILDRQADEVVNLATAAMRRLRMTELTQAVVLGGGILAAVPDRVIDRIQDGIMLIAPRARCSVCSVRPVLGAALAALELANSPSASRRRLRLELGDGASGSGSPGATGNAE